MCGNTHTYRSMVCKKIFSQCVHGGEQGVFFHLSVCVHNTAKSKLLHNVCYLPSLFLCAHLLLCLFSCVCVASCVRHGLLDRPLAKNAANALQLETNLSSLPQLSYLLFLQPAIPLSFFNLSPPTNVCLLHLIFYPVSSANFQSHHHYFIPQQLLSFPTLPLPLFLLRALLPPS